MGQNVKTPRHEGNVGSHGIRSMQVSRFFTLQGPKVLDVGGDRGGQQTANVSFSRP